MGARDDVLVRIGEIEGELRDLFGEVHELRALVLQAAVEPAVESPSVIAPPAPEQLAASAERPASAPSNAAARTRAAIANARILLSEGRPADALDELEAAVAICHGNARELELLTAELEGLARYRPRVRDRALTIAGQARSARVMAPTVSPAVPVATMPAARMTPPPRPSASTTPPAPPLPPAPPAPPRRGLGDLARDWDLLGPRGFAIVGGAVTALGIILLFVLAANRGWIDPARRVMIGAAVSSAAVGIGFWIRRRYGQMQASLGAVGAGLAGGYASLAAAAARYDLVPDWLALPLAGGIAAVAVIIAIAWSSEILAAIGLVGAALAPALEAIDIGMTWPAAAFAVIVLAATVWLSVPRRWHPLLVGIAVIVTSQVAWLAHASDGAAGAGAAAVVAALVLVVLAAGIALQRATDPLELGQLAVSFALAAVGLALMFVRELYEVDRDRGLALATAAAVWALAWALLYRRQPSLGLVLGVSALTLGAVASANLLSGTSLAVTWAAESVLLSWLAWRLRDARLQATALAYGALAGVHVLVFDAPPTLIFVDPVAGFAAVSVAALAITALAAGLLAPSETIARSEAGLLSWLAVVRTELGAHREGLREGLVLGGVAAGTYAAAIVLVSIAFRPGHLAALVLAAGVGAAVTTVSARRASMALVAVSFAWLAAVLVVAAAFDVPEFGVDAVHRSYGGWALIAGGAGVLAGGFAFQLLFPNPGDPIVPGVAGVTALVASAAGIALLSPPGDVLESTWAGWRLLAPAVVFVALSASVFRIARHRDLATIMWALAAVALLGSEWLVVQDPNWRAVAFAGTAAALALVAGPLREARLWFAGWGLALGTAGSAMLSIAQPMTLADVPDGSLFAGHDDPSAWVALGPFAAAIALFVVATPVWRDRTLRDLVTCAWGVGIVSLLDAEAFLIQNGTWVVVAFAVTAASVGALERPLRESRFWFAAWGLALGTGAGAVLWGAQAWALVDDQPIRPALGPLAAAVALFAVAGLAWRDRARHELVTVAWAVGIVALLDAEAFVIQDPTWFAAAAAATAVVVSVLERPLGETGLWLAGWCLASATAFVSVVMLGGIWISHGPEPARYAIAALSVAAALSVVSALAWGVHARRDLVMVAWATAIVTLVLGEAYLLGGGSTTAFAVALTGGTVSLLAGPLHEQRLWWGGVIVVSITSVVVVALLTPPTHFLAASASPGEDLWVGVACLVAVIALRVFGTEYRRWIDPIAAVGALYLLSLAILELAERVFGGSVQTDFERGHVAVSVFWALIGLALLVAGLIRDEALLRYGGLALFGLSLAKIFLYDLSALSSAARALSFIAVGAVVLAGGFVLQRLSSQMGPRQPRTP